MTARKFSLGQTVATPNALQTLSTEDIQRALTRHVTGDWGDCCPDDRAANEQALEQGGRLFSVYHADNNTKFWVITEADRSSTTVLMPEDY